MKKLFFILFLALISLNAISFAEDEEETIADPAVILEGFKDSLKNEQDALARFHLEEKIAKFYSSQPITKTNAPEAKAHAENLLKESAKFKDNWNYGNAVHHGNLVLGRVSLVMGDLKKALHYLQAAGKTPGSAQLKNFGPNMMLAKELLAKGQKAPVISYMDSTLKFWTADNAQEKVAQWKASIAKKKMPEFKGNLKF